MGEKLSLEPEQEPLPGSSPETAIALSPDEVAAIMYHQPGESTPQAVVEAGEKLGGRVYVDAVDSPREIKGSDGGTEKVYDVWGINTSPSDFGTRVEDMGLYRRVTDEHDPTATHLVEV